MRSSQAVIEASNLARAYGAVQALDGISFDVRRGEVFGLLGPNGAGKTTTLSILEGLLQADGGTVHVLGRDVKTDTIQIKQQIGVQLQSTSLLPDLRDELNLPRIIDETDVLNEPRWRLLERLGFRRETHLVDSVWFKGAYESEYHYAMLKRESEATKASA